MRFTITLDDNIVPSVPALYFHICPPTVVRLIVAVIIYAVESTLATFGVFLKAVSKRPLCESLKTVEPFIAHLDASIDVSVCFG